MPGRPVESRGSSLGSENGEKKKCKKETGYPASRVASIFPRKIEEYSVRRVEMGKSPWVNTGRKFAGKVYDDAQTMEHFFL